MPATEQGTAFWQDRQWWKKNWWTAIFALLMLGGVVITFLEHTSDIADLTEDFADMEEANDSLKELVVDLNTDIIQFEMTMKALIEDMGDIKASLDRVEGILMGRD